MPTTGLLNSGANDAMRFQKLHQARGSDATTQLASGKSANKASVKPSDQALASQMESLNKVIDQAKINAKNLSSVIQLGSKTLLNIKNTLASMDALAAQAQAGELGDTQRAQIHDVMSKLREGIQTAASKTEFNGTKLFTGGAGTATLPATGATISEASTGQVLAAAWLAGINAASKGYFNGTATSFSVTGNGGSDTVYDFSAKIGDQTFEALNITPANDALVSLVSTTNSANVIVIAFNTAVTATDTLAEAKVAFQTYLGLLPGGTPATFTSASADPAVELITAASASTTAVAGEYSISADTSGVWTLQNSAGQTETVTVAAGGAQNVTFGNFGITFTTAAGYATATPIDQIQFDVAQGSAVTMVSQTGAASSDTTTISFAGAQTTQIGTVGLTISAISLKTVADAALASTSIKKAMDQISTMYGNLGATMGNLELTQEVLADTSNELKNAISGIADADIPAAITEQKIAEVMAELANIAQGKALQQSQQL